MLFRKLVIGCVCFLKLIEFVLLILDFVVLSECLFWFDRVLFDFVEDFVRGFNVCERLWLVIGFECVYCIREIESGIYVFEE